jgi:hypothetical protein
VQPLGDFQPSDRQVVGGALVTWTSRVADLRFDWQRQVDGGTNNLLSEQLALSGSLRPARQWTLTGGGAYDLAQGLWGTADLSLRFAAPAINAAVTARRYLPHFDLYSVWTAFSPVPYKGIYGTATVTPWRGIQLRGRAEYYKFDNADATTPLVTVRQDGWRWTVGATLLRLQRWTFDGGYIYQVNPGASAWGVDGTVAYQPSPALTLRVFGSTLNRPLEYRYETSMVQTVGFNVNWQALGNLQVSGIVNEIFEQRQRPDNSGFDWNQTQVSARVTIFFASGSSDHLGLPSAIVRMPSSVGIVK